MKKIIFILLSLLSLMTSAQRFLYTFNPNGNRTSRVYSAIRLGNPESPTDSTIAILQNDIKVYPNPTKSIINISIPSLIDKEALISLADETGHILETKTQNETLMGFDVSMYKAGIYYVTVWIDKKSTSFKILKM